MDSKQDYFRSPTPKNIDNFYSPFRLVRHDQDPLFINSLLSPLNRNSNSYYSQFSPYQQSIQQNETGNGAKKQALAASKIQQILKFEQDEQDQSLEMATPQNNKIKVTNIETTSRKKYDLRVIQTSEKPHFSKDGQRGLRALSKQAFEIFQQAQQMTYQQVAQKIIQQNQELNEYPQKKKQRQSIKRRVYDALNVLIAVGTLQKIGKKISLSQRMKQQNLKQEGSKKNVAQKLEQKIKLIEDKKKRLQKLKSHERCLRKLINRNKSINLPESKINFPFIIASGMIMQKNPIQARIKGFLCCDVDAINKLNI